MRWLSASGILSLGLYVAAVMVPDWGREFTRFLPIYALLIVAYALAIWGVRTLTRSAPWGTLDHRPAGINETKIAAFVWAFAIGFRVVALAANPDLSDDLYRYLWDGRVLLSGGNPYEHPPTASQLEALRNGHWAFINNAELPTIYPPLLILVFAAVGWLSHTVVAWKIAAAGFDLAAGYFLMRALALRGRSRLWAVLYLWHPLVVVEFAGQGHADAVGIFFVALAFWSWAGSRWMGAGTALTLAGLVKFLPWVAVPVLLRRLRWKWFVFPALVAAFYLPFELGGADTLESLGVFAAKWRANDFVFSFWLREGDAEEIGLLRAKWIGAILAGAVWLWLVSRRRSLPSVYSWSVGVLFLVSPVVHPWYITWLLPAVVFLPHVAWWLWSVTVILAYVPLPMFRDLGVWEESMLVKTVEYLPVLMLIPLQVWWERKSGPRSR
jgi:hypothetical protein